ncbi:TWiK family of potassium channels protein 12-like [Lucilia sericata]|uniref:TWiK family of potassium channels protein 12-like n=1 Tax=Lucilia sericata TaxID=13632 RepID=UPI0018A865A4|nr:TWiK family of potassium channels protein 12-like [Lucilia sericata]XP_037826371.1 TWiK family of potassium channels protein 12-like [Lucilia sericata]
MSTPRQSFRRERKEKPPFQRFKDHFRKFTAFMFSNVGIILLVILYTIGGAFIFQAIEIFEYEISKDVVPEKYGLLTRNFTAECLERIWQETSQNIGFYDAKMYKRRVNEILLEFQRSVVHNHLVGQDISKQWSFSGAFLYSLTVITTIGYGNISPRSDWGKLATIVYAIIGMPLFLLYLSNIGDVLAKSFKWIYSKVCLCRICPGVARRRLIRERRKLRQMMMSKALADMEESRRSKYDSCTSSSNSSESATSYYSEESETSSSSSRSLGRGRESNGLDMLDLFEDDDDSDIEREIKGSTDEITVPLTVCVFIMISYILWGALLFGQWESWGYLDGSYFCFISLSSIGFGDLVPGDRVITADKDKVEVSFILCAVYLLLGMALIAMCFNLMQEQVIHNIRAIKRAFKACFRCKKR